MYRNTLLHSYTVALLSKVVREYEKVCVWFIVLVNNKRTMNAQTYVETLGRMTLEECSNKKRKRREDTNYRYKGYNQAVYTAGDVDQFNSSRIRKSLVSKKIPENINIFSSSSKPVWDKFTNIDSRAVANTFAYLFQKFKKGIFVRIADSRLDTFLPFSNAHYKNEFKHLLKADPTENRSYGAKKQLGRHHASISSEMVSFLNSISYMQGYGFVEQKIRPLEEWVANNALLRYDYDEGDNNMVILLDMFNTLCRERVLPDIEFFLNRRDFPQFKKNETEPYDHIFGRDTPLLSHNYPKYAPLLSFSSNSEFADIVIPTYEDWARAVYQETGLVFPNKCGVYPKIVPTPWKDKKNTAVFRGSSTGVGVSNGNDKQPGPVNQRLAALRIASQCRYSDSCKADLLDVGITKWNLRPRKLEESKYLLTIPKQTAPYSGTGYPLANKLSLQEQSSYKYILHLEGNVAAYRLSYELSSGSTILLAGSSWDTWLQDLITPYVHYVPVKADLSDLVSQIIWCRNNDSKCEQIAANAKLFYDTFLGTQPILDWLQNRLWNLASATGNYQTFPDLLLSNVAQEQTLLQDLLKDAWSNDLVTKHILPPTPRCIGLLDGMVPRMRSVTLTSVTLSNGTSSRLEKKRKVFENVNGRVDLFSTGGFGVVGKIANNAAKKLEHVHESYIGIKAINSLLNSVPNFCYVFGPVKDAPDTVFVEYIPGMSLMYWLGSGLYNYKQLISILVQTNLALYRAQDIIGFVHNDLYPWNVMITLPNKGLFPPTTYFLNTQTVLSIEPDIMPVIIDYGKSRAIVYEGPNVGLIDRGFANIYKHGALLDTLTLLYGTLNVLKDNNKLGPDEKSLLEFPSRLGLPEFMDIRRWSKFGALFEFASEPKAPRIKGIYANPKHFIDFIFISTPPNILPNVINLAASTNSDPKTNIPFNGYEMERGINPVVVDGYLKTGARAGALQHFIKHVDQTRPCIRQKDVFIAAVQSNLLKRRLEWVDNEILSPITPDRLKTQWKVVRKVFDEVLRPDQEFTTPPFLSEPMSKEVYFDNELTPLEATKLLALNQPKTDPEETEDWATTRSMLIDAFLFSVFSSKSSGKQTSTDATEAVVKFLNTNGFSFLNKITSHCTLKYIQSKLT